MTRTELEYQTDRIPALISTLIATILAVSVFGCEETQETNGEAEEHEPVTPTLDGENAHEQLCSRLAEVLCYDIFECCTGQTIEDALGTSLSVSESECRRDLELVCRDAHLPLLEALERGSVSLDIDAAERCLRAQLVEEGNCFSLHKGTGPVGEACTEAMVIASLEEGERCLAAFECMGDSYCGFEDRCTAFPVQGERCDELFGCADGSYCDLDEEGNRVCRAEKKLGESCYLNGENEPCEETLYCRIAEDAQQGVCEKNPERGEECGVDRPCQDGLECSPGTCEDGRICLDDRECSGQCEYSQLSCSIHEDCGGYCEQSGLDCSSHEDCPGECSNVGTPCSNDWDCGFGRCSESGAPCSSVFDCGWGSCSGTGDDCYGDRYCPEDEHCIPAEECVLDERIYCLHETCTQDYCAGASSCDGRICLEGFEETDFCEIGLRVRLF